MLILSVFASVDFDILWKSWVPLVWDVGADGRTQIHFMCYCYQMSVLSVCHGLCESGLGLTCKRMIENMWFLNWYILIMTHSEGYLDRRFCESASGSLPVDSLVPFFKLFEFSKVS